MDLRRAPAAFAKLLSVLRGDKYMADAYPPDWPPGAPAPTPEG